MYKLAHVCCMWLFKENTASVNATEYGYFHLYRTALRQVARQLQGKCVEKFVTMNFCRLLSVCNFI